MQTDIIILRIFYYFRKSITPKECSNMKQWTKPELNELNISSTEKTNTFGLNNNRAGFDSVSGLNLVGNGYSSKKSYNLFREGNNNFVNDEGLSNPLDSLS